MQNSWDAYSYSFSNGKYVLYGPTDDGAGIQVYDASSSDDDGTVQRAGTASVSPGTNSDSNSYITDSSSTDTGYDNFYFASYTDDNEITSYLTNTYDSHNVTGNADYDPGDPSGTYTLYIPAGAAPPTSIDPTSTSFSTSTTWNLCFLSGTTIATTGGDRAVEALSVGDMVLTADGGAKEVRWVGRSTHARIFADPARAFPIRIKEGALGENMPARDLLVSPGHAVLVRGVLVQAAALVNDVSVVRETPTTVMFTYYHVELDSHELLLAEGLPAESFLMGGEHMVFDNIAERPAGLGLTGEMSYPRVKSPRQLPASIRALLAERAAAIAPGLAIAA